MSGTGARLPGGVSAGHWTDAEGRTGCTVVLVPDGAVAGVDVRGGTPDTMRTDALRPGTLVERAHAILLTGGSGYVGGRLIPMLERRGEKLRCLARHPEKMSPQVGPTTEVVRGDVLDRPSLDDALRGVHTAYYLVHLMSGSTDFEREDRQAAANFAATCASLSPKSWRRSEWPTIA